MCVTSTRAFRRLARLEELVRVGAGEDVCGTINIRH